MMNVSVGRPGTTLIELLVTISLIAIVTSVVTLAARRIDRPDPAAPATVIADTLPSVLSAGRSATLEFLVDGHPTVATVYSDGTVIADSALRLDRFTGKRSNAR